MKTLSQLKTPSLSLGRLGIIAIVLSGLSACYEFDSDSKSSRDKKAGIQLKESASQKAFKQYLTASFTNRAEPVVYNEMEMLEDFNPIADDNDGDSSTGDFSGTNNQVAGVDEGDIWKYDGENFFVIKPAVWDEQNDSDTCHTLWAPPGRVVATVMVCQPTLATPAKLRIVTNNKQSLSTIELNNFNPSDLYLTDKNAVILGNQYPYQNSWSPEQNWKHEQTHLMAYNIENKAEPALSLSLSIEGQMIKSRRMGDEIFVISRYRPNIPELIYYPKNDAEVATNKSIINNLSLSELMPKITISDQQHDLIADNTCLVPDVYNPAMGSPSLTMMTRINTKTAEFNSRCMAGEVAGIYMSENNLYTFNTSYWDFSDNTTESLHWNEGNTHLHKFGLESFAYQGSALIEGRLAGNNPRLRLGELKDGSIALITSKRPSNNSWRLTQHKLTVLNNQNGTLKTIAYLPNDNQPAAIGKVNEEIYSVRFMQDRAYIVTFEKSDPLYVIDLSNSSQPNIAGELEIPGYSDYLHPIGNDLLLGVGKDAVVGDSGITRDQGVKVSLFNVQDIKQPTELGSIIIGKRGSSTALSYDLHSFTGIQQDGQYRFAFPISVHEEDNWIDENGFFKWSKSGLYLFEVKENHLTHMGAMITDRRSESNVENNYWTRHHSRRGLIQGDDVYHLNGEDLYKANWNSPEQMSNKF